MAARKFKTGQIVRYGAAAMALCRLGQPHDGAAYDWLATDYEGDTAYVLDRDLKPATGGEVAAFVDEQRRRRAPR